MYDLQQNGHDVRWYAGPLYQPKLAALGIPWMPYDRATEITGEYTCAGVTSHDPEEGMGKVDITVRFTAKS